MGQVSIQFLTETVMVLLLMIAMSLTPQAMQAWSNPSLAATGPKARETPAPRIFVKNNSSILSSPTDGCRELGEKSIFDEWSRGFLTKRDLASSLQRFRKLERSMFSARDESCAFGILPCQVIRDSTMPLVPPSPQSSFPGFRRYPSRTEVRYLRSRLPEDRVHVILVGIYTRRFSFGYQFDPRKIRSGDIGRVNVLADWVAIEEQEHSRPGLIIGTGTDHLATPRVQTVHVNLNKELTRFRHATLAGHVGLVGAKVHPQIMPAGGLDVGLFDRLSGQLIFDGVHAHAVGTVKYRQHSLSLLMVRFREVGASYAVSF